MKSLPLPVWTLGICAIAGLVFALPQLQPALVYNREAIGNGELWRLLSGNLVHFSPEHVLKDVLALLVAGTMIELRRYRHFALLCITSGALIGVVLYVMEPTVLVYGGLSGVAIAAITYLALQGTAEGGAYGRVYQIVLVGLLAKIILELAFGSQTSAGFVLVPLVHVVGALTAGAMFALIRRPALAVREIAVE
jgi:rhomboid family GlyGly-CTERM serine protease